SSAAIEAHLGALEGRQPFRDLAVDQPKERLELLPAVDDLDDHRQILRQALDLERVEPAVRAESHHPAEHRRPGQSLLAGAQHQPPVEQHAIAFVALADEDAKETAVLGKDHGHLQMEKAVPRPAQTAPSATIMCARTLARASPGSVARTRLRVSLPKAEKVVKPPSPPTPMNARASAA